MDLALKDSGSMFDKISLSITRRDIVLMDICLGIMARDYTKGANLSSEIESLQTKLKRFLSPQDIPKKKQAECGGDPECGCRVKTNRKTEIAIDLICGMRVDPKLAPEKAEYMGKTYYFCTAACKKAFDSKPDKYA